MPREYKFQALQDYLTKCERDAIELTFDEIEKILDFELATSAYHYEAYWQSSPTHTITKAWENAGYVIGKVSIKDKKLQFLRTEKNQPLIRKAVVSQKSTNRSITRALSEVEVNRIMAGCTKYFEDLKKDSHARYLSWEHCYKAFREFKGKELDEFTIDYLSLHLGFYLASWGMYRGSSFLLQKDYKVHQEAVIEIYRPEYEPLWGIACQDFHINENQKLLDTLYHNLQKIYIKKRNNIDQRQDVSDTLITKILLGTLGCVPAYDQYFISGIKKYEVAATKYSIDSIMELVLFFENNCHAFENCCESISSPQLTYPQMKILDMCFWQVGFDADNLRDEEMRVKMNELPDCIMGKSLDCKVIPTVCNLKNMLSKLKAVNGDVNQLEQWEKRSYKAYNIDAIKQFLLNANQNEWPNLIRQHILTGDMNLFGASCIDIYLVAYVANKYGVGKDVFAKYIFAKGITENMNSVSAIWTVGKGDGIYLGVLNDDGSIKDHEFIEKWIVR